MCAHTHVHVANTLHIILMYSLQNTLQDCDQRSCECQTELHKWGHAIQVEFDPGKESFHVIPFYSLTCNNSKIIRLICFALQYNCEHVLRVHRHGVVQLKISHNGYIFVCTSLIQRANHVFNSYLEDESSTQSRRYMFADTAGSVLPWISTLAMYHVCDSIFVPFNVPW